MHKLLLATLLLLLLSRSSQHRFLTSSPAKVMPMVLGLPVSHKTLCTSRRRKAFSQRVAVVAGFGEDIRKALDSLAFERWAPRSSRAWRLGGDPISRQRDAAAGEAAKPAQSSIDEDSINALNVRISQAGRVSLSDVPAASTSGPDDSSLAASFNQRLKELSGDELAYDGPLTGPVLREAIERKYGKTYDLSIVRREIPGKTLVALNVMWTHLAQQSFPMSEADYMDKLDTLALYLNSWGQTQTVLDFFNQPAKSQRGLPARPVVGCAVSCKLDLPAAVIEEWFN